MNTRIRQEYLDADYLAKLSDSELEFLNQFYKEYYNANFDGAKKVELEEENWRVLKSGKVVKEATEYTGKHLHDVNDRKVRKELTDNNNHRNVDLYSSGKATGTLMFLDNNTLEEVIEAKQYAEVDSFGEAIVTLLDEEDEE